MNHYLINNKTEKPDSVKTMYFSSFHSRAKCSRVSEKEKWVKCFCFVLFCPQQYLHVQFGAVPDQVPFAKHWRVGEPLSKYPSMHEYTMEWEKVVPSTREMRPWVGVAGLLHCTAGTQRRKQTRRSEVERKDWSFLFIYFINQGVTGWGRGPRDKVRWRLSMVF